MSIKGALRYVIKSITGGPKTMLKPGDPAPDFNTTDHTGKPVSLKNLRGKKVVLWFFPKADTPG
jgi:peroxiredoxin Q/BCP